MWATVYWGKIIYEEQFWTRVDYLISLERREQMYLNIFRIKFGTFSLNAILMTCDYKHFFVVVKKSTSYGNLTAGSTADLLTQVSFSIQLHFPFTRYTKAWHFPEKRAHISGKPGGYPRVHISLFCFFLFPKWWHDCISGRWLCYCH